MLQGIDGLTTCPQPTEGLDTIFAQQATAIQELVFAQLLMPSLQKGLSAAGDSESEEE